MSQQELRNCPRILILEDDEPLRGMLVEILGMKGFPCSSAATMDEALVLWRSELSGPDPFRMALTDLTLGQGQGGMEFARRLQELDPSARLIACTGDSSNPIFADPGKFGFERAIVKPFLLGDLMGALLETIGNSRTEIPGSGCPKPPGNAKLSR